MRSGPVKTHCPQGHELTKENLHVRPNGYRECRTCRNEAKRAYRKTPAGKATLRRNLLAWATREAVKESANG